MRGRPSFVRCVPCAKSLPFETHDFAGRSYTSLNSAAFNVAPTGREKIVRAGRTKRRFEWKCRRCGHVWWSTQPSSKG